MTVERDGALREMERMRAALQQIVDRNRAAYRRTNESRWRAVRNGDHAMVSHLHGHLSNLDRDPDYLIAASVLGEGAL